MISLCHKPLCGAARGPRRRCRRHARRRAGAETARSLVYQSPETIFSDITIHFGPIERAASGQASAAPLAAGEGGRRRGPRGLCGAPRDAHGSSSSAPVGPRATIPHSVPAAASRPIAHTIAAPPLRGLRMPRRPTAQTSGSRRPGVAADRAGGAAPSADGSSSMPACAISSPIEFSSSSMR